MTSSFLTTFFYLDALLNFGSALKFLFSPPSLEREPLFLVQTLGVYFVLGGGTMLVAASTKDVAVRRGLMLAYVGAGILHAVAALHPNTWAIPSGKYALAGDMFVTGVYSYFLLRGE